MIDIETYIKFARQGERCDCCGIWKQARGWEARLCVNGKLANVGFGRTKTGAKSSLFFKLLQEGVHHG